MPKPKSKIEVNRCFVNKEVSDIIEKSLEKNNNSPTPMFLDLLLPFLKVEGSTNKADILRRLKLIAPDAKKETYEILPNGVVNYLDNINIIKEPALENITFGKVKHFTFEKERMESGGGIEINSFKGFPIIIEGSLNLEGLKRKNFKTNKVPFPIKLINGDLRLSYSLLENLEGLENCEIIGTIEARYTKLKSLKGLPQNFKGALEIGGANIKSFEGCPPKLESLWAQDLKNKNTSLSTLPRNFNANLLFLTNNPLKTLKGIPESFQGDISINNLESLEGLHPNYKGKIGFFSGLSHLKTLKGFPRHIKNFHSQSGRWDNKITSLEGLPQEMIIEGKFNLSNNNITSLKGMPKKITFLNGGYLDLSNNKIKNLDQLPLIIEKGVSTEKDEYIKKLEGTIDFTDNPIEKWDENYKQKNKILVDHIGPITIKSIDQEIENSTENLNKVKANTFHLNPNHFLKKINLNKEKIEFLERLKKEQTASIEYLTSINIGKEFIKKYEECLKTINKILLKVKNS